jgi:hypothetical protein
MADCVQFCTQHLGPDHHHSQSEAYLNASTVQRTSPLPDESIDTLCDAGRLDNRKANALEPEIDPPTKRVRAHARRSKACGGRAPSYDGIFDDMEIALEHTNLTAPHPCKDYGESLNVPDSENKHSTKRRRSIGKQSRALDISLSKTHQAPDQLGELPRTAECAPPLFTGTECSTSESGTVRQICELALASTALTNGDVKTTRRPRTRAMPRAEEQLARGIRVLRLLLAKDSHT